MGFKSCGQLNLPKEEPILFSVPIDFLVSGSSLGTSILHFSPNPLPNQFTTSNAKTVTEDDQSSILRTKTKFTVSGHWRIQQTER